MNNHPILISSNQSELYVYSIPQIQICNTFHLLPPSIPYHVLERESSRSSSYRGDISFVSTNIMELTDHVLVVSTCLSFDEYRCGDEVYLQSVHLLCQPWSFHHLQFKVLLLCCHSSVVIIHSL